MTPSELERAIEAKEIEARRIRGGPWRLTWESLADFALSRWTLLAVTSYLGRQAPQVFPPMALPRMMTVYLPDYQVRMLFSLALRHDADPDTILSNHLLDLAASVAEEMEAELPGFTAAMHFPEK
jgi:hypothetical protein